MKAHSLLFLLLIFSQNTMAQTTAVKKAVQANYSEYIKYLEQQQKISFSQAYLELNEKRPTDSNQLEECLMDLLQENTTTTCDKAIFALTRRPLNGQSAEVLASLLNRLTKSHIKDQQFFDSFLNSLMNSWPELKANLQLTKKAELLKTNIISGLEYQAWLKMLLGKAHSKEITLLVNGKRISSLRSFLPQPGVFQWSLITNSYEPLIYVGTWQQFAHQSQKSLLAFFSGSCEELQGFDIPTSELLSSEIFLSDHCQKLSANVFQTKYQSDHLEDLSRNQDSLSLKEREWVWPSVIIATGIGILAHSLKNKKVKVTMPGLN